MKVAEKSERALHDIFTELRKAIKAHPVFPTDKIYAAAILAEEVGELVQACNDYVHNSETDVTQMKIEAAQVGAMALRFLISIED